MKQLKSRTILFSSVGIVVLLAILILLNVISSYVFTRLDLTSDGIYSLSSTSKRIIRNLENKVIIKAYFSRNLPVEYSNNKNYLRDLLSEYRIYSKGNIKVEFVDPSSSQEAAKEAMAMGVSPVRFTQIQRDEYKVGEGYMGLVFIYSDKREVMPYIKTVDGIEYDITGKITKLSSERLKKICFERGHAEGDIVKLDMLYRYLDTQYEIEYAKINEQSIPDDVDTLILMGPRMPFTDESLSVIEQFLMQGKTVGFVLDSYDIDRKEYRPRPIQHNLDKLLNEFGISMLPGFVLDKRCSRISVQTDKVIYQYSNVVEYPFYPVVDGFNKNSPIVKNMDFIVLPFVNPLQIEKKAGVTVEKIIESSPKSWYEDQYYSVDPYQDYLPGTDDQRGPFTVAVAVTPEGKTPYKAKFIASKPSYLVNPLVESSNMGRMFIVSSAQFIYEYQEFFMNIIDWLVKDEKLMEIRSEGTVSHKLGRTTVAGRLIFKYISIFLMPIIVALLGLLRWRYRLAALKKDKLTYG